ncbi:disulfide bond formation protein DsbB [Pseudoalteromonas sp. MMG013]|uniref:disulfide bond formation protein DsbB n=1 Tax=Pseudoalteromonas sp. MMG013 TaxID=2822687 RepID=UPI001B373A58|nr:disulfide bond formation protein DsbB [Pseudoalteromonas sp. MMG013]MBQ4861795.1 disulfide bond formation protein DsbB [Pseudoalteromonas sp. MMG013]
MNWITSLSHSRPAWVLLAVSAFVFEAIALFFQYQMELAPCIMCIYQRTAMLGLLFAGLVGAINPSNTIFKIVGFSGWGLASIWGWLIAREHTNMQTTTDPFAFTCDIVPNFPEFLPLHEWLPSFFAATGDCGNIDWQFMNMSMPNWMEVIFAFYSVCFITAFAAYLFCSKRQS